MILKRLIFIFATALLLSGLISPAYGWIPPPPGTSWENNNSQETSLSYDSTLQMESFKIEVDGKTDSIGKNGSKISREAKEESDIEVRLSIKNIWEKDIEDIDIEAAIEDIDDGDDLKADDDISLLEPGDSKRADLDFKLPLRVDEGSYTLVIEAKGIDEDHNVHTLSWEAVLEVEKEKHNLKITKASLSPSTARCGENLRLSLGILNLGRDEEEVKIEIKNEYLEVDIIEEGVELGTGTDNDASYEKSFRLTLPSSIESGTYYLDVNAYYDDGKSPVSEKKEIAVECITGANKEVRQLPVKSLPPTVSEKLSTLGEEKSTSATISAESRKSAVLLFTLLFLAMLGLIIFLLAVIIIINGRRRKRAI
ncbi:hypothetical protein KY358_03845 [Candidatus Woesearchaeota archaeon]|nr:hypothetical protein [Candidatus Woesearchaeota archaeon]